MHHLGWQNFAQSTIRMLWHLMNSMPKDHKLLYCIENAGLDQIRVVVRLIQYFHLPCTNRMVGVVTLVRLDIKLMPPGQLI